METMARVVRGMQANDCFGKQMQCIKKESDVHANAVRKEHAEDTAYDLMVWNNEESIMRAFWDADFNGDVALHLCKSQSASLSPTTHSRGHCHSQGNAFMLVLLE